MKIKQIGTYNGDIISTILENRKIKDIELFYNPTNEHDLDAFKIKNMRQGAEVLLAHLLIGNEIGILVDPDADGFTSASIIYQYIKKIEPNAKLRYFLHDNKAHGLTEKIMEQVANSPLDLLVIPDAASNDEAGIQRLYHMGMDLLIIDHHEVEKVPSHGIIINNQLDWNIDTNKNLVGAGMAFKFCQALDEILSYHHSEEMYDLVAIGQVGDASDISQNEVRNMVFKGLRTLNNPFIRVVLEDRFEDLTSIAPIDLSFSIIPLINSIVRVGTMEEKELLFRALNSIDVEETFTVTRRKKNKVTGKMDKYELVLNFYEYAYHICTKVKTRQDGLVKKTMAVLEKDIDNSGGIAIGILETSEHGSITGLVANKIASKLQKPVLLVHHVNGKYVGSGRGYEKSLPSLKDWCNETELVEFAQGHANAFGISIFEEDFEKFKEQTKNVEKREFIYEVDLHLHGKIDKKAISDVNSNKHLFGGKVREPLFAFTGIKVRKDFIRQRGSMLTFFDRGIEFVMYGAPAGLFESLTYNFEPYIEMNFVGRPSENNWGGRITTQIVLSDCSKGKEVEIIKEDGIFEQIEEEITAATLVF
ncbi:DHH family phosphoesterase [Priestia megaterium]|uniref:DHH family phosphoesterase n=1 Tax=Priestia megaterium TaxID=1404 RepID=UPI000BEBBD85|nr:DHH family phosphoesterase [Priestia megaterium]PED64018.1 hypothetical protein CON20_23940 [Priestia megaterium]